MNQPDSTGQHETAHGAHEGGAHHGERDTALQGQGAWGQVPHAPLQGTQGRPVDLQHTQAQEARFELPGGPGAGMGGWGHVPEAPHDPQGDEAFDPEYLRWREQQLRALDEDYRAWRQDRYRRFADEFTEWRARRAAEAGARGSSGGSGQRR